MPQVPVTPLDTTRNQPAVQTLQSARGSEDASAFGFGRGGEAVARAFSSVGNDLFQIQQEMQARDDAVFRAGDFTAYSEASVGELRRLETEGDLADETQVRGYLKYLDDEAAKTVANHKGSEGSRAALAARLQMQRAQHANQAMAISIRAKEARLDTTISQHVNKAVTAVRDDPSSLAAAFSTLDETIADLAPGMTPEKEQSVRQVAQSEMLMAAMDGLIDRGGVDAADRMLLDTPGADALFTPSQRKMLYDRMRQARAQLAAAGSRSQDVKGIPRDIFERLGESDQRKILDLDDGPGDEKTFTERTLSMFAAKTDDFVGGVMSEAQERRYIAGVNEYIQPRPFQDPITGLTTFTTPKLPGYVVDALARRGIKVPQSAIGGLGDPTRAGPMAMPQVTAPQAQPAAEASGAGAEAQQPGASPPNGTQLPPLGTERVGTTAQGRPVIMNEDGTPSTERTATLEVDGRFVNVPTMFNGQQVDPRQAVDIIANNNWTDPETGQPVQFFNSQDEAVAAAEQRSAQLGQQFDAGGPSAIGAANTPAPEMTADPTSAARPQLPQEIADDETVRDVADNPIFDGLNPALFQGGKTVAEMGEDFTGPMSALRDFAGRIPFFGAGGGEATAVRTTLPLVFNRLVASLQTNPRFADAERQSILNQIKVTPRLWDNENNFFDEMIGIDRALEALEDISADALKSTISAEQRKHELDTIQKLGSFRRILMPPRMETDQAAEEFMRQNPPGTRFLAPDENGQWAIWRVPGG